MEHLSRGAVKLAKELADADMSQKEAGSQLQVSQAYISRLIRGHKLPSMPMAARIRNVFGVMPNDWTVTCSGESVTDLMQ